MEMNRASIRYFSSVTARKVDWLWYPYIPFGKITIIQGDPGDGKTTLVLNIATLLSNGMPMPESDDEIVPAKIIYQSAEELLLGDGVPDEGGKFAETIESLSAMLQNGKIACAKKTLEIKSNKHADGWYWSL